LADLTHDAEDGFHEIHLTGKQLVFLFIATTVISVIIFLCGVLVGRGVGKGNGAEPEDSIASAAPVSTPSEVPAASAPAIEPPPAAGEEEPPLTYKQRLESPTRAPERLKPQDPPAAERPPARAAQPVPSQSAQAQPAAPGARPGVWVVQLVAIRDRAAASSIVDRLRGKGYPAFLVPPTAGSPAPVFKVQVGRYPDRGEAERIADRLKKEERFQPWIQR
jgi:cell division septation protein DedD